MQTSFGTSAAALGHSVVNPGEPRTWREKSQNRSQHRRCLILLYIDSPPSGMQDKSKGKSIVQMTKGLLTACSFQESSHRDNKWMRNQRNQRNQNKNEGTLQPPFYDAIPMSSSRSSFWRQILLIGAGFVCSAQVQAVDERIMTS